MSSPPPTGAIAWRSFSSVTRAMPNAAATCRASTRHGTLVSSAASPITGPATPKHAVEIDASRMPSAFRKAAIIEFEKSSDEPLELMINNKVIGLGETVKVGENFGLRITLKVAEEPVP